MSDLRLPPFPVDDGTLDMLMAAINPWEHGDPDSPRSSLWDFLTLMSQMGGSDTTAVEEVSEGGVAMMRDPMYTDRCVITALIGEVRRLRGRESSDG